MKKTKWLKNPTLAQLVMHGLNNSAPMHAKLMTGKHPQKASVLPRSERKPREDKKLRGAGDE